LSTTRRPRLPSPSSQTIAVAAVGGALVRELRDAAKSQGYSALSLSVEKGNPALRLYERNSFVKPFETEDAWAMGADLFAG
jgi:hypothetical protein